jgi:hypothetical protein
MRKLIETASSVLTAASMLALILGFAVLSRPSWGAEPLTGSNCDGCASGHDGAYCGPCLTACFGSTNCVNCSCDSTNTGEVDCPPDWPCNDPPLDCSYEYECVPGD